jgi:hypothetical protein
VPFLGSVPLDPTLREAADAGIPNVLPQIAEIAASVHAARAGGFTRTLPLVS